MGDLYDETLWQFSSICGVFMDGHCAGPSLSPVQFAVEYVHAVFDPCRNSVTAPCCAECMSMNERPFPWTVRKASSVRTRIAQVSPCYLGGKSGQEEKGFSYLNKQISTSAQRLPLGSSAVCFS